MLSGKIGSQPEKPAPFATTTNRSEVYSTIDSERAYQDAGKGNAQRVGFGAGQPLTPGEIILCMEKTLHDARETWYRSGNPAPVADFIRKTAALGVQFMEAYGAPRREGF